MVNIDLNRLTYRDYRSYLENGGDAIPLLTKVVTAWGYPGDPQDPASYENLGLLDLLRVQAALREAIQNALGTAGN